MNLVKVIERGVGPLLELETEFVSRQGELIMLRGEDYKVEAVVWKPEDKYVVLLVNKTK